MSPIPATRRLFVPNFKTNDPKADENWRALDRWQNAVLPGGEEPFFSRRISVATANLTISLPPKNDFFGVHLKVSAKTTNAADVFLQIQFNGDVAAHYDSESVNVNAGVVAGTSSLAAASGICGLVSAQQIAPSDIQVMSIHDLTYAGKGYTFTGFTGGSTFQAQSGGGGWFPAAAAAITSITLFPSTGNFDVGSTIVAAGTF